MTKHITFTLCRMDWDSKRYKILASVDGGPDKLLADDLTKGKALERFGGNVTGAIISGSKVSMRKLI